MQHSSVPNRRDFLRQLGLFSMGAAVLPGFTSAATRSDTAARPQPAARDLFFKISLAEWSFHKALFAGKMKHLDFPQRAAKEFDIHAVEYVNQFFKDKAKDKTYLADLKQRCADNGVRSVLIMCDGEGELGHSDEKIRKQAVENHYKWVEAAEYLGCHAIRVNAGREGDPAVVAAASVDGLRQLAEFAKPHNIRVIVENHGGISSNGAWLAGVLKQVPNGGALPDFGNFCLKRGKLASGEPTCEEEYDRYQGVTELMPYAGGVSAKTYNFDAAGNCTETDYLKMMGIVKAAGYKGYVGIEYEGDQLSEEEGIRKTKDLLLKVGAELS
ncbi:MAG TPA: sugar phosphate isomerase/epimerase family protein [Chitinophaga sp.]